MLVKKFTPVLALWGIFIFAVFKIPYPDSLAQANFKQVSLFFIPLFLAIIFTLNTFFKNILMSSSLALCLFFLLILKALDSLNIVTGILIAISAGLLFSYFKKAKKRGLTKSSKIPKLTKL